MAETLQLDLVTPEKILLSEPVDMAVIPGQMGDFGVLAGHAPLVSLIRPGIMEVTGENPKRIFLFGGVAEVQGSSCTVLAEEAFDLAIVTKETAQKKLEEAQGAILKAENDTEKQIAEAKLQAVEAFVEAVV